MRSGFAQRLRAAIARHGPLCTGVDPSPPLLSSWGLSDDAHGLRAFASRCVEAFGGEVAAVKPQSAFFERHGADGMAALAEFTADARAAGLIVVADVKRGDFDVTNEAYADAWLGPASPWAADAVTVHPYLGLEALAPFVEAARASLRGVFVVARSSNPEGRMLQEAVTPDGRSVEDRVLAGIAELNRREGKEVGSVGAVVGATLSPSSFDLAELAGPVLAPGIGAQGGDAKTVAALFGGCPRGSILPSTSRSVLARGPSASELRAAAARTRDALGAVLC